ncbi:MAG: diphthine--ammonia ligase [Bacteroidales bacterium]|nr:diphthine--ammonia ligase [Bacteroidales bacterium]
MNIVDLSQKGSRAFLNWSGGKDAAFALFQIRKTEGISVERLLTTVGEKTKRVAMHAVREELVKAQAVSIGIPLDILYLPENPDMETYEQRMLLKMKGYRDQGLTTSVFGDINLQDLRRYRENQLEKVGMEALFPLWDNQPGIQAKNFIEAGFKAIVVSVNAALMDESYVGADFDRAFLDRLPLGVDPCGENGEFHTFVYDGPLFNFPIAFTPGEKVFWEYPSGPSNPESNYSLWQIEIR